MITYEDLHNNYKVKTNEEKIIEIRTSFLNMIDMMIKKEYTDGNQYYDVFTEHLEKNYITERELCDILAGVGYKTETHSSFFGKIIRIYLNKEN